MLCIIIERPGTPLKISQMLSQERRLERYKIIYIWKILENRVPNCGIESSENLRLSRICKIPPIKRCSTRIQNLRENCFQISGPQLFNILPQNIRNMTKCSIDDFKLALDKFCQKSLTNPTFLVNTTHPGPVIKLLGSHQTL